MSWKAYSHSITFAYGLSYFRNQTFMEQKTLHNIYILQLKDIYSAENQMIDALPKMAKASTNKELKASIFEHLEQTREQALRIEEIFRILSADPRGENCNAMEGLIEEMEEMLEENENSDVIDISIVSGLQKIKHYEIASYGCVITYAKALADEKAAEMLQQSLDEEYEMDNKLDKLSEEIVHIYAH
jgi:ferritin-like metal-binding protein YciE